MSTPQPNNPELAQIEVQGITRQSFILKGALATGAVLGVGAVGPYVTNALAASSSSDVDILNFALTLEYLEANFYNVKAKSVGLSGHAASTAALFGGQEEAHVKALTAAVRSLGGKPAAMPKFVFPATSQSSFLKLAFTLENVGVGAYNGAGPSLTSTKLLAAAGSIVQVEARHAATIALLISKPVTPDGAFDKPLTKSKVLADVKPLIK